MHSALIVTHSIPRFPASGAPMRDYCLAREMAKRYRVTFLLPDFGGDSRGQAESLKEFCQVSFFTVEVSEPWSLARRIRYSINRRLPIDKAWQLARREPAIVQALEPMVPALRARLAEVDWSIFDLVQVEHSHLAAAMDGVANPIPAVLDWHNVYSVIEARRATQATNSWQRWRTRHELRRVTTVERRIAGRFDHSVAVSNKDAEAIRKLDSRVNISVVPNGVDCEYFCNPEPDVFESTSLVFTGTMDYEPNEEAVLFFCEQVLPRILEEVPELRFYIVGQRPSKEVRDLEERFPGNVHVTGFVDDVRPYLQRSAVSVVPLLNGGGTRLKILEAMAMQKPVVSTPMGAEGLNLVDGREIVLAEDATRFARSVLSLLTDQEKSKQLSEQGHMAVKSQYDWHQVAAGLNDVWERAIGDSG